jgi:hypothetical protein
MLIAEQVVHWTAMPKRNGCGAGVAFICISERQSQCQIHRTIMPIIRGIMSAPGLGYPMARVCAIFSLSGGVIVNMPIGRYPGQGQSELALVRQLLDAFCQGDRILVRVGRVQIARLGFRSKVLVIATSLVDPIEYPTEELALLYRKRWNVEVGHSIVKTNLAIGYDALQNTRSCAQGNLDSCTRLQLDSNDRGASR